MQSEWPDYKLWKGALGNTFPLLNIAQGNFPVTCDCFLSTPDNWYELLLHSIPRGLSCWPYPGLRGIFPGARAAGLHSTLLSER